MSAQAKVAVPDLVSVPDESLDDVDLLGRIRDGDPESLRILHLCWRERFRCIAMHILQDGDDAEDAATEAVLRVHELAALGAFPTDAGEATRWIRQIGRDCAFRQRRRPHTLGGEWIDRLPDRDHESEDEQSLQDRERQSAIATKALQRLPRRTRRAVRMYLSGASYYVIAKHQGGSIAGARSRVDRGILLLVATIYSRQHGRQKAERAESLSPEDHAKILNEVAAIRTYAPEIGMRAIAAEVCRRTKILIHPRSASAFLLMDLHQRRP